MRYAPAALALGLIAACTEAPPEAPAGPEAAALALFELARAGEPSAAELELRFDDPGSDLSRAALLEALEAAAEIGEPRVLSSEPLPGLERVAVDIAGSLPGGGSSGWSVQLVRREETWKIVALGGPGWAWPTRRPPRGEGLTTSSTPTARD